MTSTKKAAQSSGSRQLTTVVALSAITLSRRWTQHAVGERKILQIKCPLGSWAPCGEFSECRAKIGKLIPNHEYLFRIVAVNAQGESKPLDADDAIVAKNAFGAVYEERSK